MANRMPPWLDPPFVQKFFALAIVTSHQLRSRLGRSLLSLGKTLGFRLETGVSSQVKIELADRSEVTGATGSPPCQSLARKTRW